MYKENDWIGIAKRENNTKRSYLVVNRLQGKHVPVSPQAAFGMFDALAEKLKAAYGQEKLLVIGFAETATAIGARLAVQLGAYYIQTTREQIPDAEYLFFLESHSHATEQKLVRSDLDAMAGRVKRIVFAEDEVTTGNTILNIIRLLKQEYPGQFRFAAASLLNGMDPAAEAVYHAKGIELFYLRKSDHMPYAQIADSYDADGAYFPKDMACHTAAAPCLLHSYLDTRRCVDGAVYAQACAALWEQVKGFQRDGKRQNMLVLGTEEFMYPALYIGECLEKCGNTVRCHATTRSPIAVSRAEGYPLHSRYELESLYESGRRTFLYDLEAYDCVWILTDAAQPYAAGAASLVNALRLCKNQTIRLFCWHGGRDGEEKNEKLL